MLSLHYRHCMWINRLLCFLVKTCCKFKKKIICNIRWLYGQRSTTISITSRGGRVSKVSRIEVATSPTWLSLPTWWILESQKVVEMTREDSSLCFFFQITLTLKYKYKLEIVFETRVAGLRVFNNRCGWFSSWISLPKIMFGGDLWWWVICRDFVGLIFEWILIPSDTSFQHFVRTTRTSTSNTSPRCEAPHIA